MNPLAASRLLNTPALLFDAINELAEVFDGSSVVFLTAFALGWVLFCRGLNLMRSFDASFETAFGSSFQLSHSRSHVK